jgi:hypothetical protein
MILSGLSAATAILVPSSGIARGWPQWGRSATDGLVLNPHGHVIKPGGLRLGHGAQRPRRGVKSRPAAGCAIL